MHSHLFGRFAVFTTVIAFSAVLSAGSLVPPPGPPASTQTLLEQSSSATVISSLPYVISAPGLYRVSQSMISSSQGIRITTSDVTLDLGGHTLSGDGSGSTLNGILVDPVCTNVTIRNGKLDSWDLYGLRCECPHVTLSNVGMYRCGLGGGFIVGADMDHCVAEENLGVGMVVHGGPRQTTSQDGSFSHNASHGYKLQSGFIYATQPGSGVNMVRDRFNNNGGSGVYVESSDPAFHATIRMTGSFCDGNGGDGLGVIPISYQLIDSTADECSFSRNTGHGISQVCDDLNGDASLTCKGAVCVGNGGNGVNVVKSVATGGCTLRVTGGTDSDNDGYGIVCTVSNAAGTKGMCTIDGTAAGSNALGGLSIVHRDVACRNVLAIQNGANPAIPANGLTLTASSSLTVTGCTSISNSGKGSSLSATRGIAVDCRADLNVGNGIECDVAGVSKHFDVQRCSSSGNGGHGVLVTGATGTASLSSVSASGNTLDGINVSSSSSDCDDSSANRNGGSGIVLADMNRDGRLDRCVASGNGGDGVTINCPLGDFAMTNVSALDNNANGITCACNHLRVHAVDAVGNTGNGLAADLDGDGDFSAVTTNGNGIRGTWTQTEGPFSMRSSSSSSNGESGVVVSCAQATIERLSCSKNTSAGLELMLTGGGGGGGGGCGASIERCVASGNGTSGLHIDGNDVSITDNKCAKNTGGAIMCWGDNFSVSGNTCSSNGRGIVAGCSTSSFYDNSGRNNGILPFIEDNGIGNDIAPSTTAAASSSHSPTGNVTF